MKLSSRALLGLVLGALALTACDYQRYSPGVNTQFEDSFVNPPGWRSEDVNLDSVNEKEQVHTPIGKGSARDLKTGTVQDQINSAPAGKSATSPQAASGTLASPTKSTSGNGPNTNDVSPGQQAPNISNGTPNATNNKGGQ